MKESLANNNITTAIANGKEAAKATAVIKSEPNPKERKETGALDGIRRKLSSFGPVKKKKSAYYEENIKTRLAYFLQLVVAFSGRITGQLMESYKRVFDFPKQESGDIYANLGHDFLVKSEYKQAVVAFKKSLELYPEHKDNFYYLANAYFREKDYKEAINVYLSAINANPESASAYFELGLSYAGLEKYDQATDSYRKAIKLDPENAELYYCLGVSCDQIKNYRLAVEHFKQAIELNPRVNRYYHSLGFTYECIKQHDNAIECFKKAIELERE